MARLASCVMTRTEKVGVDLTVTVGGMVDACGNPRLRIRIGDVAPHRAGPIERLSDTKGRGYSRFYPRGRRPSAETHDPQVIYGETVFAVVRLEELGDITDGDVEVTVTEVLSTEEEARSEAMRLNALAAGRRCFYLVRSAGVL